MLGHVGLILLYEWILRANFVITIRRPIGADSSQVLPSSAGAGAATAALGTCTVAANGSFLLRPEVT